MKELYGERLRLVQVMQWDNNRGPCFPGGKSLLFHGDLAVSKQAVSVLESSIQHGVTPALSPSRKKRQYILDYTSCLTGQVWVCP
jgi:hypothetical protein